MKPNIWMYLGGFLTSLALSGKSMAQVASPATIDPGSQIILIDTTPMPFADEPEDGAIRPWIGVQHQTGPGVGYRDSFTTLDGFIPVYINNIGVIFADLRGYETNTGLFGANLGAGVRYLSPELDRIFGFNAYFDNRDTGTHSFNQVGLGVETLGPRWDFRANVYMTSGDQVRETSVVFSNPTFLQHHILLGRSGSGEGAMQGVDCEFGVPIPAIERFGVKAYFGGYQYQGTGGPQLWGPKARLETRPTDDLDLSFTVSNDREFGTSLVFSGGFRFGSRAARAGSAQGETFARLSDRVERNTQIVVRNVTQTSNVLAIDPETNQPIFVEHVNSNAPPGGDGTVEHPFITLAQEQAASAPHEILFVHANSAFTNQLIVLQDHQRFLGEGITHYFTATQGTFLLPRATTGTTIPIITAAPGSAVTLANFDEVSGFNIVQSHVIGGAGGHGIFGTGVSGFDINRNIIITSDSTAILITGINGTGRIVDNTVTNNAFNGIVLGATNFTGAITGNNISNNNNFGFVLNATNVTGDFANNNVSHNANTGVNYAVTGAVNGNFVGNTVTFDQGAGGIVYSSGSTTGDISGNNASTNQNTGMRVTVAGALAGNVDNNTASNNTGAGGLIVNAASVSGSISGNTANVNSNTGIRVVVPGAIGGGVSNNTANADSGLGGLIVNAGSIGAGVNGNSASNNPNTGIQIALTGALNGGASNNTANANTGGVAGLNITAASVTGDISGNHTSNDVTGLKVVTGAINGNISNNLASTNANNGINVNATSITGNFSGNTASGNNNTNIQIADAGAFNGSFSGNTASNSLTNFGINFSAASVTGNLSNNTTNGNQGNTGLNFVVAGAMAGDISGNTSSLNLLNKGINFSAASYVGNVTGNTTSSNAATGLDFNVAGPVTGTFSGNTANTNGNIGINVASGGTFTGNFINNTANGNLANTGFVFTTANLIGNITGNTANANAIRGMSLVLNGTGPSTIGVLNNNFSANSVINNQFRTDNTNTGLVDLTLNGNTGSPPVQAAPANFFFNSTGGLITLHQGTNTGSVATGGNVVIVP